MLNDAEEDLRDWQPSLEEIHMQSKGMGSNLMPQDQAQRVAERKLEEEGEIVVSPDSVRSEGATTEVEKTPAVA